MDGDESAAGEATKSEAEVKFRLEHFLLPVVRTRIVPRLLVNLSPASLRARPHRGYPSDELIDELVDILLKSDIAAARDCVDQVQRDDPNQGPAVLNLLGQAARVLGRRWDVDKASFSDVAIAMSHLSALLRYSSHLCQPAGQSHRSVCMLMARLPGDQHSFGLSIAAEHFSREGFDVHLFDETVGQSLIDCLSTHAYDVVGFSLGESRNRQALAALIAQIRAASVNRNVGIIVGGPHFAADQASGGLLGADLVVHDLHEGTANVLMLLDSLRDSRAAKESLSG